MEELWNIIFGNDILYMTLKALENKKQNVWSRLHPNLDVLYYQRSRKANVSF